MRTCLFISAILLASASLACGESHDAPDIGGSADGATDSGGGTPDGGGGVTDGGGTSDGGGPVDAGSPSDGGALDAGGPSDGGVVFVDASRPDSGGGGTISCGMTTCNARTEQCCISGGAGGTATAMCIPVGDACMGGTADCDGPEDCGGGEVCCGRGTGGGFAVSCVPEAMCGGFTSFEICHDASDCSSGSDMCCPIMAMGLSGAFCAPRCFGAMP